MARTAKTNITIKNAGVLLGEGFDTLDLNGALVGTDEGGGIADLDDSGGAGGSTNVATESVTAVTSGNNVTIDLTQLSHTALTIQWISRNGNVLATAASAPSDGSSAYEVVSTTATVFNALSTDQYLVSYTY